MSEEFVFDAQPRTATGRSAARRLRRIDDMVPVIIYGDTEPLAAQIRHRDLERAQRQEAFYTRVLTIRVAGREERAILKGLQRHPARNRILHADFQRVSAGQKITVHVPLHFLNEDKCVGVKMQGGLLAHAATDIEVRGLPEDIPEHIEVDVEQMDVGQTIHISDLQLPEGVESVALGQGETHDLPLVNVLSPRGGVDAEAEEAADAAAAAVAAAAAAGPEEEQTAEATEQDAAEQEET